MAPKLNTEEIKLRGSLLGNNRELLQLHKTLVRGGLLSEEEFWETRQSLLKSQETLLNQKKSTVSSLGSTSTTAGAQNDHKIVLTPETILAILTDHAALNRAHKNFVPERMSEKEFWTYYVRSKFFSSGKGEDADNPLDAYYEETGEMGIADGTSLDTPSLSGKISRLIDIEATAEDHQSDINDRTMQLLRSQASEESLSLIRKFNNNSLKAIQSMVGSSGGVAQMMMPPIRIEDAIELEDLREQEESSGIALEIKSVISPSPNNAMIMDIDERRVRSFIEASLKGDNLNPLPVMQDSLMSHAESASILPSCDLGDVIGGIVKAHTSLPADVTQFHSNAAEILRHYWSAAYPPPGKDAERKAKASRMNSILEQFLVRGRELVRAKGSLQEQVLIESALGPILDCTEWALQHFRNLALDDSSKRIKT